MKIKIQKNRKDPIQIIQIRKEQNISEFSEFFKEAYEKIRYTKHQTLKIPY